MGEWRRAEGRTCHGYAGDGEVEGAPGGEAVDEGRGRAGLGEAQVLPQCDAPVSHLGGEEER